ncbi:ADP-forming succinate--CoA ligase subunit beta [Lyticum sinuosum]|uniref:Succinate--CoA ligase [ADP-forming] subunit beta n=1 Tax=Lyticum sinuosum TaxID=1332059 RepID=A0AAE4VKX7_9RICK|nr:ADP-forming succinate--CoA ligase subunit beta [Lyticum sinuosum]MDZ5760927.1 Succinyl-CoA ligase [ADP-forming] subunit beta [Lyticum sinuosum]
MNIHEYQAKNLIKSYGINIPNGKLATSVYEALIVGKQLLNSAESVVIKAQVHAGGRSKAGGIKTASSVSEVAEIAASMLNKRLITSQTNNFGKIVKKIYIEEKVNFTDEIYISFIINHKDYCISLAVSEEGGINIDNIISDEKIHIINLDPLIGFKNFHFRRLFKKKSNYYNLENLIRNFYQIFVEKNLMQLEINPLVVTNDNQYLPLDAKVIIDDNAIYKHHISYLNDEDNIFESKAKIHNLCYIRMNGNIGCIVNGAGLAMATMDIIHLYGGKAANFLDVGGGAAIDKIIEGFNILISDKQIQVIFVNIFGGIMRCDLFAEGIILAIKKHYLNLLNIPIIVRFNGFNAEIGKKILNDFNEESPSSIIHIIDDFDEATIFAINKCI